MSFHRAIFFYKTDKIWKHNTVNICTVQSDSLPLVSQTVSEIWIRLYLIPRSLLKFLLWFLPLAHFRIHFLPHRTCNAIPSRRRSMESQYCSWFWKPTRLLRSLAKSYVQSLSRQLTNAILRHHVGSIGEWWSDEWQFERQCIRTYPDKTQLQHGGDIRGLKDSSDYLQGMGIKVLLPSTCFLHWHRDYITLEQF
jgi:hypothetical protein